MNNYFLPYLEWEILSKPVTFDKVEDRKELPEGYKKIMIDRDDNYNLRATLSFKSSVFAASFSKLPSIAGSFPETFDVDGFSDFARYTLESCLIENVTTHLIQENQETPNTAILHIGGLRIRYKNENESSHLIEWYLNGPRDFVFRRITDRKLSRTFSRTRLMSKDNKIDSIEVSRNQYHGEVDFLRIKAGDLQFLVTKVPKEIGPNWSSNIGIEYHRDWGRIPDADERKKIEELCSFVFGRQFLSVGYTIYDQDNNAVEGYSHNPWGEDARYHSSKQDEAPIRINHSGGNAEDIIGQLLSKYYEMREPLHLKEALWHYWVSRRMPIGTNLPILAAALESIMNGWHKSTKSKSRGVYMKKQAFESLLEEEIKELKIKLENKPGGDKILASMLQAYCLGITERYRVFFEEIGLSIDANEWEAIKARHTSVHGHMIFDKTNWRLIAQHVNTFETLLHKVLLKILGYSGTYIDRSVVGWTDKQLSYVRAS
jgi:hypothetical protein